MTRGRPTPAATVVDHLQRHAAEQPDAPAIVCVDRTVSYRELRDGVAGCAAWLKAQGIEPGERVGLSIADDRLHAIVALGLAAAGATHVVLPTHDAARARRRTAERVGARRVVVALPAHGLAELDNLAIDPARADAWAGERRGELRGPDASSLLTFFTTSGTTGEAKIIPVRHDAFARQTARARVGRVLSLTPMEHAIAKRQLLYAVIRGSSVALRDRAETPIAQLCARLGVDIIASNAARSKDLIGECLRSGRLPPGVELTAAGSHTTAAFRCRLLEGVCDAVQVTYSMQECGSVARAVERTPDEATSTVGRPHPGVEVVVADPDGTPLPAGEVGEIRIRAGGMAEGYLDDDEATARHFRDGWFLPGDLGTFTPEGALIVQGRADDVMILNGIKIAPIEIERALERHPVVRAVVAFPLRSPVHGEVPVAAVELVDGFAADEHTLQRFARDVLGMRAPRRVIIVPALPTNAQGKIDLGRLAELASSRGTPAGRAG